MNFILVQYCHQYQDSQNLKDYYSNSERHHRLMVRQIRNLYPDASIHVITDTQRKEDGVTWHYIPDLEKNNYAKLHVFSLLNEPAIYIDNDIILVRRFATEELPSQSPFNLYQTYKDVSRLTPEMQKYKHYNTGIIYIAKPSIAITDELLGLRDRFRIHKNGWVNDEYPISHFVHSHNLQMLEIDQVNKYREDIAPEAINSYQSVHYTGCKELLLAEYHKDMMI